MKHIFLLLVIFNISYLSSQEATVENKNGVTGKPIENRKHDIKLGIIKSLSIPSIDIEYEYKLRSFSSFGINVETALDNTYYERKISATPFFRYYLNDSKIYGANGFFTQAFLSYYHGENIKTYENFREIAEYPYVIYDEYQTRKPFNAMSIGFGLGQKWVTRQGFIFQIFMGGARSIVKSEHAPNGFFHSDLYVGYRF